MLHSEKSLSQEPKNPCKSIEKILFLALFALLK